MTSEPTTDPSALTRLASAGAALAAVGLPLYLAIAAPHMTAADGEALLALHRNPWWVGRAWITMLYFAASLAAVLAVCVHARQRSPLLAATAAAFFLLATGIDLIFRAQQLLVVSGSWDRLLAASNDPLAQSTILLQVDLFLASGAAFRAGFLMAFAIARLAVAGLLWGWGWLGRVTAVVWAIAGCANLSSWLGIMGASWAPSLGSMYLLPWGLSFLLLALWLAGRRSAEPAAS